MNLGLWILKLGINVNQELDEGWRNAKLCENLATEVVEVEINGLEYHICFTVKKHALFDSLKNAYVQS